MESVKIVKVWPKKTGMNIHIINEHEPKMVRAHFEKDWVMKHKQWISGTYDPICNLTWGSLNTKKNQAIL